MSTTYRLGSKVVLAAGANLPDGGRTTEARLVTLAEDHRLPDGRRYAVLTAGGGFRAWVPREALPGMVVRVVHDPAIDERWVARTLGGARFPAWDRFLRRLVAAVERVAPFLVGVPEVWEDHPEGAIPGRQVELLCRTCGLRHSVSVDPDGYLYSPVGPMTPHEYRRSAYNTCHRHLRFTRAW